MSDLRVPLHAVEFVVGVAHRLDVTDVAPRRQRESRWDLLHLVGVARPDARRGRERPDEWVVRVDDVDVDVGVTAVVAAPDGAAEFVRDELHAETDAEDGDVDVEVLAGVADAVHRRAAREDDAVHVGDDLVGRGVVVDEVGVDTDVTERALFEMGELPVVVDDGDTGHCAEIVRSGVKANRNPGFPTPSRPTRERTGRQRATRGRYREAAGAGIPTTATETAHC